MFSNKIFFWTLLATNLMAFLLISQNYFMMSNPTRMTTSLRYESPVTELKFTDPEFAYLILEKLDVFEVYHPPGLTPEEARARLTRTILGLTYDDHYCDKHRARFVMNPNISFKEKSFMTNYRALAVFRSEVIPRIGGRDLMPNVHSKMDEDLQDKYVFDLRDDLNMFFTSVDLFSYRQIGKHFSCLTQISNHVPGHELLYRKDQNGKSLVKYGKRYLTRPQCFNDGKFFPKTWVLTEADQCREFFSVFNSPKYNELKKERGMVYIRKIGAMAHQGRGVFPVVSEDEENYIRNLYKNGERCGKVEENNLIQYAVWNPLLLNGHKFDFRMFMLIASTNPTIVYYRDGFLRVSLRDYDPTSKERGAVLTNIALSKPFFEIAKKNGTYNGYTEDELLNQAFWTMPKLEKFLYDTKVINDPNWLNNYLRPEFKKAYIHLIRMSQATFAKKSSLYEIFGLDFMLDQNLDLWFIEANAQPLLDGWSADTKIFFNAILYDSFEIVYGLLRSRVKRIVHFVNKIIEEEQALRFDSNAIFFMDLQKKREEFKKIIMNYFEPEFLPGPNNGFSLIVDDNLDGVARYNYLLEKECL